MLRRLGYRRKSADFWPDDITYYWWYRTAWEKWVNNLSTTKKISPKIAEGLNCPGCMSLHLSWFAGLCSTWLLSGPWWLHVAHVLICAITLPYPTVMGLELLRAVRRTALKAPASITPPEVRPAPLAAPPAAQTQTQVRL